MSGWDIAEKVLIVAKWLFIALAIYGFYSEPELLEYALH